MTPGSRAAEFIRQWRKDVQKKRMLAHIQRLQDKKRRKLPSDVRRLFEAEAAAFTAAHGPIRKIETLNPKRRRSP